MRNTKVQKMITISMLSAVATVLQFFDFPVFPAFSFLKIDFSDIPIMIGMFLLGPFAGIATAFIRSLLHCFLSGATPQNFIGDSASFLATLCFTFPIYGCMKYGKHQKISKLVGLISGTLALTIFMSLANYFVITPFYLQLWGISAQEFLGMSLAKYLAIGIIPFNLIKGSLVSMVFVLIHAKLLPWIASKKQLSHE